MTLQLDCGCVVNGYPLKLCEKHRMIAPHDYIEAAVLACGAAAWEDGFPIEPKAWDLDYEAIEASAAECATRRVDD